MPQGVRASVQKISFGLFNLLFPENCRLCDEPLKEASRIPVCGKCLQEIEPLDAEYHCVCCRAPFSSEYPFDGEGRCGLCRRGLTGFDAAYSYGFYDGRLRKLIQLFKYGNVPTLVKPFGEMLGRALPRDSRFDLVVPMPMHWWRRWNRGYNQAELLAREVARRSGLPVKAVVKRSKATAPQAGLTGAKRRANVAAAFRISKGDAVKGRRILLIDDVLTTGASAGACARELKRAGAGSVTVLTVARADRRTWVQRTVEVSNRYTFQPGGSLADGKSGSLA